MKQLVILSGKGGTGKTSLAAAFAYLAHSGPRPMTAVLADADVDAANLELVLQPQRLETHSFIGPPVARIEAEKCHACGTCAQVCRFDAILTTATGYEVDPIACDGCAACVYQCPEEAISMQAEQAGQWYRSASRYGPLFHANLRPAQENSGKLVTLVKQQARMAALDSNCALLIVDGPPGIGCPVISAISGANLALVVAEPTAAGVHDMRRIMETTAHFRTPTLVCINKADIYPQGADEIEHFCHTQGVDVLARIPFDDSVTQAMLAGEPVSAYRPDAPAAQAMQRVWEQTMQHLGLME